MVAVAPGVAQQDGGNGGDVGGDGGLGSEGTRAQHDIVVEEKPHENAHQLEACAVHAVSDDVAGDDADHNDDPHDHDAALASGGESAGESAEAPATPPDAPPTVPGRSTTHVPSSSPHVASIMHTKESTPSNAIPPTKTPHGAKHGSAAARGPATRSRGMHLEEVPSSTNHKEGGVSIEQARYARWLREKEERRKRDEERSSRKVWC